ncbi:N-6 DNA methylase [Aliivibrio fischeri]|uniref:N-6 DNA methylase n=1 Tax=Aliivibrio fischeri TaxID=668 RepID=UPI001F3DE7BE|nr:N-6 DNA methylase [Aliivibrio fischeri]MCE7556354.1 SAM-dependent methyltransferase [Aliivibrio fischeri]MCE7563083.1 SAM-dependent methyltransferase [Aliivibrio fischeri]MCE7571375.1 SAM-dependent methyltransferase [Aliivibrio fischeri]
MNPHSLPKKRELGAYYTPPELSQILADWAISKTTETILEPSFGGCGFFDSCIKRLQELGCKNPDKKLYGVDIDPHAFDILSRKFDKLISTKKRFLQKDFITVTSDEFLVPKFDVVLGNPPYVSMHNMTEEQRKSCDRILQESSFSNVTMGRNASLWAFFLLHSLSFLQEGGKVAWVLPSSLLHADYAKNLINIHKHYFKKMKLIKLAERFFKSEGAKETSIVLIAEGFDSKGLDDGSFSVEYVDDLVELKQAIDLNSLRKDFDFDNYKLELLPLQIRKAFDEVSKLEVSYPLSHYLDIKIGMVTGANKYFIVDQKTIDENYIQNECLKPVVGRFSSFIGIKHTKTRQNKIQKDNHRAFLVNPTSEQMYSKDSTVNKYLSQITREEREKNRTFEKRPDWFAPDDDIISDGFMSYMIHLGPRMVINQGRINCTNSIHKVFFHTKLSSKYKLAIAVSMLSTYSQFSAEIEGRAYSSGVLKIEPSAGRKIKILLSECCIEALNEVISEIESYLKDNNLDEVTAIVDRILIRNKLISIEQCDQLARGVHFLRKERYKGVRKFDEK